MILNELRNEQQARYDIASATQKTFQQVLHDGELQRERFERAMGEF